MQRATAPTLILGCACLLAAANIEKAQAFSITGSVGDGQLLRDAQVLDGFGCKGGDRSPAISWTDQPTTTKSLAITMYDPDAPTGSGWWHWTVFNLPPTTHRLVEGAGRVGGAKLPPGAVQGRNDFGEAAYGGACPPVGDPAHRYVFTVWALDTDRLALDAGASGAMVGFFLHAHTIATTAVTMRYGR